MKSTAKTNSRLDGCANCGKPANVHCAWHAPARTFSYMLCRACEGEVRRRSAAGQRVLLAVEAWLTAERFGIAGCA